ncbi:trans isomerase C [Seminavis robusta]|uniref:Peptidyl-prolyl cis-trans isomerase n=1 Tax=Seminavis robusta TaxID=568900 RepID=A0A9N8EC39_9STRA|nr:trans isomerase C [Seminavis robusta]|eukprot:Sro790_g202850.1 trans isomerase C (161) ;mRNA; f:37283-37765
MTISRRSPATLLTLAILALLSRSSNAFVPQLQHASVASPSSTSRVVLSMGLVDDLGGFMKRFTTKATASHILIKGGAEAENKLEDLKEEIGDSPVKFAEYAAKFSACPSASSGGSLGEFGPGAMVKEFDTVVFNDEVGKVHGPVKTQFGYHLIYISDRTE